MPSRFERSLERLKSGAVSLNTDTSLFPVLATLNPVAGGSSSSVRFQWISPKRNPNFSSGGMGRLDDSIQRTEQHTGSFPPNVVLRIGDRLTLGNTDQAGQVWEVTEPIWVTPLGYRVGLSFVGGTR